MSKFAAAMMTAEQFGKVFELAPVGTMICYHRGILGIDKSTRGDPVPGIPHYGLEEKADLSALAKLAMALEQSGRAELLQKRHGAFDYEYFVVKRRTPGRPCRWPAELKNAA